MANNQEKLVGSFGSDIYAAGTYYVGGNRHNNLRYPIYAVEYAGSSCTLTNVQDSTGGEIEQNFCNDSTAITSDMGLMVFRENVHSFTCSAVIKVWYAS